MTPNSESGQPAVTPVPTSQGQPAVTPVPTSQGQPAVTPVPTSQGQPAADGSKTPKGRFSTGDIIIVFIVGVLATVSVMWVGSAVRTSLHSSTTYEGRPNPDAARDVKAVVEKAIQNERKGGPPDAACWYPGSPAQESVRDRQQVLVGLDAGLNRRHGSKPLSVAVEEPLFFGDGVAEVVTRELWFQKPEGGGSLEPVQLSRTFYVKKYTATGTWKVYSFQPIPIFGELLSSS